VTKAEAEAFWKIFPEEKLKAAAYSKQPKNVAHRFVLWAFYFVQG